MIIKQIVEGNGDVYWRASGEGYTTPIILTEGETRAIAMQLWCEQYARQYERSEAATALADTFQQEDMG